MYNWKIYNKKKIKLARKFDKFNNKNIFNFVEKSYYNHNIGLRNEHKKSNVEVHLGKNCFMISNLFV